MTRIRRSFRKIVSISLIDCLFLSLLAPIVLGDTVNIAARIEATGKKNQIHISKQVADLLIQAGKKNWIKLREDRVQFKSHGDLETFWLLPQKAWKSSDGSRASAVTDSEAGTQDGDSSGELNEEAESVQAEERLVFWVAEQLLDSLRHVVAHRNATNTGNTTAISEKNGSVEEESKALQVPRFAKFQNLRDAISRKKHQSEATCSDQKSSIRGLERRIGKDNTPLDEVVEIVDLPEFDAKAFHKQVDPKSIELDPKVESQLREYIAVLASFYRYVCICISGTQKILNSQPFAPYRYISHSTSSFRYKIHCPSSGTTHSTSKSTRVFNW